MDMFHSTQHLRFPESPKERPFPHHRNTPPGLSQGAPNRLSNQSNQDLSQRIATFSDQRGEASDLFFLVVLGVAPEFLSMRKKGTKSFPNASCLNELYDDKWYWWCKKSCTSWYGQFPLLCRVSYVSGGAGFLPSTVVLCDSGNHLSGYNCFSVTCTPANENVGYHASGIWFQHWTSGGSSRFKGSRAAYLRLFAC